MKLAQLLKNVCTEKTKIPHNPIKDMLFLLVGLAKSGSSKVECSDFREKKADYFVVFLVILLQFANEKVLSKALYPIPQKGSSVGGYNYMMTDLG